MKHIAKILIFAMLLSLLCIGGTALAADYTGVWEYDDYYMWYQINDDGTWQEYYEEGLAADGYYEETSDGVDLLLPDGSLWYSMTVDGDVMTDDDGDTLFLGSLPDFTDIGLNDAGAVGVWEYAGDDMTAWIQIYEGGTFVLYNEDGAYASGTARILDDGTVGLMENYDDDDDDALMALMFDGDTAADTQGEEFILSELPYDTASGTTSGGSTSSSGSGCIGVWEYDDYYLWYRFNADGTWEEYGSEGLYLNGYWEDADGNVQLYLPDGSEWYLMTADDDVMTDEDGDTMSPGSLPEFEETGLNDMGAAGVWEYTDEDLTVWIQIYEAGAYVMYDEDGALALGDVRILSDDTIGLYYDADDDDSDTMMQLTIDGDSAFDDTDEEFFRSELPYDIPPASSSVSASGYDGVWEYDDYYMWIEIDEAAGTFVIYDEDGEALSGTVSDPAADGSVDLNADGESVTVSLQDSDTLVDWDGDTLFRSELPDF